MYGRPFAYKPKYNLNETVKLIVEWQNNYLKKGNIFEISQELNLGLDSIVFLDDNPFERERVKHSLPEVFVPELPKDPMLYRQFLLQLDFQECILLKIILK